MIQGSFHNSRNWIIKIHETPTLTYVVKAKTTSFIKKDLEILTVINIQKIRDTKSLELGPEVCVGNRHKSLAKEPAIHVEHKTNQGLKENGWEKNWG